MPHQANCTCPACRYRRGEGKGQLPPLSVRLDGETKTRILSAPEGARSYLEKLVREEQQGSSRERQLGARIEQLERELANATARLDRLAKEEHRAGLRERELRLKIQQLEAKALSALPPPPLGQDEATEKEPLKKVLYSVIVQELPEGLTAPKGWTKLTRVRSENPSEALRLGLAKLFGKRCRFEPQPSSVSVRPGHLRGTISNPSARVDVAVQKVY